MTDPDAVVVARLVAAGLQLVSGTNIFRGKVRPAATGVPVRAVFVEAIGGARNARFLGSAGKKLREYSVTARVRSETGDSAGGRTLAHGVHAALDHVLAPDVGYVDVRCDQPCPVELGQDELGAHEWSVNVTLRYAGT